MRLPVLTIGVTVVTAATNIVQLTVPGTFERFGRTPAGLHGEWWRTVTSLFVQDNGVAGIVSNLLFLALIGAIAEQVASRPRWLLHYFGVGLVSEFVGYLWQPVGGGSSIAICGLTGIVAVALWQRDARLPRWAAGATFLWCGALFGSLWWPLAFTGVVAVWIVRDRPWAVRPAGIAVVFTAVVLSALTNIHGGALVIGVLLGLLTTRA
ncbi:rhomboid family intramembrane serine protease [Kutzneria sp. NPDC052558]|uniref:rhomboid family intramembrane serine protease n=1 Tax=Kutzneria sp. NPDC052558 TaxID=3364121 RepID=UPI0037C7C173